MVGLNKVATWEPLVPTGESRVSDTRTLKGSGSDYTNVRVTLKVTNLSLSALGLTMP